ncbi:MAG TPA: EAL domain-containing protein [Candidatus Limnocylindrales bacterium]|nr:EAL domain-containing protein [Candidatus Limnocylindrales bacterium]
MSPIIDSGDERKARLEARTRGRRDTQPARGSEPSATTQRVLIADDDPAIRSLLERVLRREGFATALAATGREAIEQIERQDVDVLLLDVHMPELDGISTLREIRADDRWRTMSIILMTGSVAEAERVRGLEYGADDYLSKPFALKELAARVRAQLRGRAAWTREIERARGDRRRLAAAVEELPRDVPLVMLAANLVERLPSVLGLDGVAILHFSSGSVRAIAGSGALRTTFPPGKLLPRAIGREIATRAEMGPWLEAVAGDAKTTTDALDVAYVPFRLGPTPKPLGCLVYARRPGSSSGPLSHQLPDLIDSTDFIVAILRPVVEQAETAGVAVARLQRIIVRQEFDIYLQPIVRLDTGVVIAVEALTRFHDRVRADLQFAEAATHGLGLQLQRTTLEAAIEAAATLPASVALSVNLSADVLLLEPTLPAIMAGANRPLIVEITEHERIDDYSAVRDAFDRLGPNMKLAVDDAGSGFASLRHILALRPSYVKLDIEWVHAIDRDPVKRSLVSGLAYFARETACELIAEGIETEGELEAIRELGIQLGQGYLLGRPQPLDQREDA